MEPPSSNLDDYFSQGSVLFLLFLFYAFISGLSYAFSSFCKEHETVDSYPAGISITLKRLLVHPADFSGMVAQFSILLKLILIFLSFYMIKNPVWAAVLTFSLIIFGDRGIVPFIRGKEYLFLRKSCYFTLAINTMATSVNFFLSRFEAILNKNREEREAETMEELTKIEDSLKGIVSLTGISAKDIMCPRVDIVAVNTSMNSMEVIKIAIDSGYSRIPVYKETLDNIIGFLYIKDLIGYLKDDVQEFDWYKHIREAYFVPESKKVNDLLEEFRQKKMHLAMVVDEYGGTDGLVTLEDILEEIVGEIEDETD